MRWNLLIVSAIFLIVSFFCAAFRDFPAAQLLVLQSVAFGILALGVKP